MDYVVYQQYPNFRNVDTDLCPKWLNCCYANRAVSLKIMKKLQLNLDSKGVCRQRVTTILSRIEILIS